MSSSDLKHNLGKFEYPVCANEALVKIENLIINRGRQEVIMDLISEFIFLENKKECDNRKFNYTVSSLSLLQELQLVVILCEYFSEPGSDSTRNTVFLSLFGGTIAPNRSSVLMKLISASISGLITSLLCVASTWMQQIGCTSIPSTELAHSLVKDFVIYSRTTSEQLRQLPLVAPRFAANFMAAATDLYMKEVGGIITNPPDILLEAFTEWVTENSNLCLASQQPLALPIGAIAMPVVTPLAGLIRWCVLAPIICPKGAYNKLHLAILQTLLQIRSTNTPSVALNAQHLTLIVNFLKSYAKKIVSDPGSKISYQKSLERLAQAVQVSLSSKCIYGSIPQLICLLETLPTNNLMDIVIKAHKNN